MHRDGSLRSNLPTFPDYFSSRNLTDPSKVMKLRLRSVSLDNHQLCEDQVAWIVSVYRVTPTAIAPANVSVGRSYGMLALRFDTQIGVVNLQQIKVTAQGTAPAADIAAVHLIGDANCNGAVDVGETDLAGTTPQVLAADNTVTFGAPPGTLLTFGAGSPQCVIVSYDIERGESSQDSSIPPRGWG